MAEEGESSDDEDRGGGARGAVSGDPVGIVPGTKLIRSNSGNSVPYTQGVSSREGFRSLLVDLLGYGGAGGQVSVVVTSRESVGGGLVGFTEKVLTLDPLSPMDAARLFAKRAPRHLLIQEIRSVDEGNGGGGSGGGGSAGGAGAGNPSSSSNANLLQLLSSHKVMQFLGGHPQAIALATPLLLDRTLAEVGELLVTQGVRSLSVAGMMEGEKSTINTLVMSLRASLLNVTRRSPSAGIFFALLGLLPSGASTLDLSNMCGIGGYTDNNHRGNAGDAVSSSMFEREGGNAVGGGNGSGGYGSGGYGSGGSEPSVVRCWGPSVECLVRASLIQHKSIIIARAEPLRSSDVSTPSSASSMSSSSHRVRKEPMGAGMGGGGARDDENGHVFGWFNALPFVSHFAEATLRDAPLATALARVTQPQWRRYIRKSSRPLSGVKDGRLAASVCIAGHYALKAEWMFLACGNTLEPAASRAAFQAIDRCALEHE